MELCLFVFGSPEFEFSLHISESGTLMLEPCLSLWFLKEGLVLFPDWLKPQTSSYILPDVTGMTGVCHQAPFFC
jgi:hypothetical protein